RELCSGKDGLENLQPKQHERLYGWKNMEARIAAADADRKDVIQAIWNEYAEDLIQRILKQAHDQIDEKLKQKQDQQQNQDQDGQEQDGQDQDGQEQDGQSGGKPQKGQKGQKGKKGKK